MRRYQIYRTVLGLFCITADRDGITDIRPVESPLQKPDALEEETPPIRETYLQLEEYLSGIRRVFRLKLNPPGTPFQKKVWEVLEAVPYGEVRTCGEIAAAMGEPHASREVAAAAGSNPLAIVIPSHRLSDAGITREHAAGNDLNGLLQKLEREKSGNTSEPSFPY